MIFDSASGNARVRRITERTSEVFNGVVVGSNSNGRLWSGVSSGRSHGTSSVLVCATTPCVAYLPYGEHEVILSSLSEDRQATYTATSSDKPHVFRASLNAHIPQAPSRTLGVTGIGLGLGAVLAGALLQGPLSSGSGDTGAHTVGYAFIGGGLVVAAIGVFLFATGHPSADYEGRSIEWALPSPAASSSSSTP